MGRANGHAKFLKYVRLMINDNARNNRVTVLGAGSWGTALAIQLARAGNSVFLWGRSSAQVQQMAADGSNERYLPGCQFPTDLLPVSDFDEAVGLSDVLLISVPSHGFRDALLRVKETLGERVRSIKLCWATKGFELSSGALPHQLVQELLPDCHRYAVVSGPTFALEVGAGLPSGQECVSYRGWSIRWLGIRGECSHCAY